ncbi:MAG: class II glutamine amidotransferase [Myxococcales bacterium]|nr:class II glutamine amidotransferase [Myxococcales bacterium]MCB9651554.1 class II glutamine amidotransferase [Deltaproteobacteria bacterium]
MCRLFGFRSVIPSQVHSSLIHAENALGVQSERHPDGWGVAYYVDGAPHLTKSASTALTDQLFRRVSGVVASETVLAHVRKATQGDLSILNAHPFQYGKWVFAHNGDIPEFGEVRATLLEEVAPRLRRFVLGDTDSEVVFFMFLTSLSQYGPLGGNYGIEEVIVALRDTVQRVRELCDTPERGHRSLLTLMVTNGATMAATRGGKELFWSSYKTRCSERDSCPSLSPECEAPSGSGFVNHLILSSEPLGGENVWHELEEDGVIGVDWRMRLTRRGLFGGPGLVVV